VVGNTIEQGDYSAFIRHENCKYYIILPVVLYGFETWSLTLWEEYMPIRIFRSYGMKVTGGLKEDTMTIFV
jgi:hypothetical protein